jgi:hypothetical protein
MKEGFTKQWCDLRNFFLRLRIQLRFGRLSRAPLRLLRLEWSGDHVNCDWLARPPDEWDEGLPQCVGDNNQSLQALEDAIQMRELLFCVLNDISSATFRVYRQLAANPHELIIVGTVVRSEPVRWWVDSVTMRAKLCGLQFSLDNGRLVAFQMD